MNFRRSYAVFLRYIYLVRGNLSRLGMIFLWSAIDVVLWGFLTKYLDMVGGATFSFVPILLGAVILSDFLGRVQQGVTMPFMEDIWARNLLNYFASPISTSEYLFGLVCSSLVTGSIGLAVMVVLAALAFGFSLLQFGAALAGLLLILFLFGVALGIVAISIILRFGPSAEWLIWPLVSALTPFVGVFYPISVLPISLRWISYLLAPTYAFAGLRDIVAGVAPASEAGLGVCVALISLACAYGLFIAVYRRALAKGSIARFSAESST